MDLLGKLRRIHRSRGLPSAAWAAIERVFTTPLATLYRRLLLRRVVFIGVTGSTAKTTTKDLIALVLGSRFKGKKSAFNNNLLFTIAQTLLGVRPTDDFCVVEVAAVDSKHRRAIDGVLALVRPRIGVVTNIGTDHLAAFGSVENIATEKSKLVAAVPSDGAAILNTDDPLVAAMAGKCSGKVVFCGAGEGAALQAANIRSVWPDRLSFDLRHEGRWHAVETQLCGEIWAYPVLAAAAVGLEMGIPLAEILDTIKGVSPFSRRMEPVVREDGVVFIRDDQKTPITSIPLALQFMERARAARKIVVFGTISDYKGNSDRMFVSVAKQALAVADHVLFVGPRSKKCLKARKAGTGDDLHAFLDNAAAADFLGGLLRPGDLVLLKGTNRDRLESLIQNGPAPRRAPTEIPVAAGRPGASHPKCVVGLGNMGERYAGTPHNIGHRVVDLMAEALHAPWSETDDAFVATAGGTEPIYIVKLKTEVNRSGPLLAKVAAVMGVGPSDCIVVHDDADLAFGAVRFRENGSDGGHRGIRSVLSSFGTDEVRRVKLGVKTEGPRKALAEKVVSTIAPEDREKAEGACREAVALLTGMMTGASDPASPRVHREPEGQRTAGA
jgi:aminoacyl-tRNA hydrolase